MIKINLNFKNIINRYSTKQKNYQKEIYNALEKN